MKRCFKCETVKPLGEFYAHPKMADGHLNKCKECARKDVASNYRERRDYYAAYERTRFQRPERKQAIARYAKARKERRPVRYLAAIATSNAIRDGKLIRQPCEVCQKEPAQAHHDDYSRPLEVRWLCRAHHLEAHGKRAYLTETAQCS